MKKFKFIFWIKGSRKAADKAADYAYENGLTDVEWVYKGGGLFVEFEREAESFEVAAATAKAQLEKLNVPLKSEAIDVTRL